MVKYSQEYREGIDSRNFLIRPFSEEEDRKKQKFCMSEKKEKISVEDIYTPLSVAKKEIKKRWKDKELRRKVDEFFKGNIPKIFKNKPKAVLFRYVSTPNFEFNIFYELAEMVELKPVYMEFLNDKFCTVNQDKLYLAKMVFFGKNGNGNYVVSKKKVIDIGKYDGKSLKKLKTIWKEDFINFHRRIFKKCYKSVKSFNAYKFKNNGESPYEIYLKVFSLFICHGIFFEIYYQKNKREQEFLSKTILPAFNEVKNIFGVKPLIVPIIGRLDEEIFLQYYPEKIRNEVEKIINKTNK